MVTWHIFMCDLGRHLWEFRSPENPWAAGLLCILSVFVFIQTVFQETIMFLQFEATCPVVFYLFLIETTIVLKISSLENRNFRELCKFCESPYLKEDKILVGCLNTLLNFLCSIIKFTSQIQDQSRGTKAK